MIYDSTQDWNTSITYILPLDHIDYLQINNNLDPRTGSKFIQSWDWIEINSPHFN
jgi:hypothetical protein